MIPHLRAGARGAVLLAAGLGLGGISAHGARAQSGDASPPTCFRTGGGALEICRDGAEAEGAFHLPDPCAFAQNVQILRLATRDRPGPIQVVYQGETPLTGRGGRKPCTERRATDPRDAGAVHSGRTADQLATRMPAAEPRLWESLREAEPRRTRRGRRNRRAAAEAARENPAPETLAEERIGPRGPIVVAGRDWAGEEYHHVFLLAMAGAEGQARPVQIQARTYDFETFEIRSRSEDGYGITWTPFTGGGGRGRRAAPAPTAVLDEAGRPVVGNCPGEPPDTQALSGSISVVDQTYHYIYTDTLPEDCREPAAQRRTAVFLRTSRDLGAARVWSAPRVLLKDLPPRLALRAAKAKGMERWALSYSCRRPANAPGGPVDDICLQYTADLSLDGIGALRLFADPVSAGRSPAYLGLRSGGDGSGRYGRTGHFWMTDRYGNLDTPGSLSVKAGFLTWVDRLAPRADLGEGSRIYGRPVYWATWTVRPVSPR